MLEIYKSEDIIQTPSRYLSHIKEIDEIEADTWINLYAPTEEEILRVEKTLNIPQEFLRYPLDEEERPRIDNDDDTGDVLVIVDIPYPRHENNVVKYETAPLGIIISKKHIITVSLRKVPILDQFIDNRVKDCIIPFRTRFTIQILFAVAKDYLRLLRFMDKSLDEAEKGLAKSISNSDLYKMLEWGKSLIYFSTSLKSNEAVLEKLMRGRLVKQYEDDADLLEDVIIEYKQAHEMADIYASIVNGTMDAYASIINNNMNVIMKVLAAATIVLTVPNLFTSFFGQNIAFPWDPDFASHPLPFIILTIVCLISMLISFIIMKKKDWL
ncbi:MAG: magnesium transporter CorA family protein [Clostridia bacterium]|nr:magnesium transporter CorA family protein [Clostridia bacterium]